jgi:DDE superfamily endonuclease
MDLWITWLECVMTLRTACSRNRTFFWMIICLIGMTIRTDLMGVSSFMRALHLQDRCYNRLLDFMHSSAINLDKLSSLWVALVLRIFQNPLRVNGRLVLVGDGLKVGKEGRKMPAVKSLHQESNNNNKSEYIMGHSCQVVALLVGACQTFFAVPLASRIHEGLVFSNRNRKTLFDKILLLLNTLNIGELFYFVADAYYANRKMVKGLLANNQHLVTRVKSNAVAYFPAKVTVKKQCRGRPKKYGKKIKLSSLFKDESAFEKANSPVYGEKGIVLRFYTKQLYWRAAGVLVQFVLVIHPTRGRIMLMSTDLALSALEIIHLYGLRYKIELSFKNTLNVIGTYSYHFWMKAMDKIQDRSGDQYLHRKTEKYRDGVRRKLAAYHCHIQLGLIAHGLLQYLSCQMPKRVWACFGSWLRTIREGIPPSEYVVATAMKNTLADFLKDSSHEPIFMKFLREKINSPENTQITIAAA